MVLILKVYIVLIIMIMLLYMIRHAVFSINRMYMRQRMYYHDIYDSEMPSVSVLVPMYNEEQVLSDVMEALLECEYDRDKLEIIPIDDCSADSTASMLAEYGRKYPFIRPLYRKSGERGKPAGLNEAMGIARGEIIIVFDADYRPSKGLILHLAAAFLDPEAGAVMGRVIPYNADKNLLTKLIYLERAGGYQVDQQARYNLRLIPQYGGTVGGYRKDLLLSMGGFNTRVLAEDTELTYRLYCNGYKVLYANAAECYEQSPETWNVRGRQIRRWSRGHNSVMFRYFIPVIASKKISLWGKFDGLMLLGIYATPLMLGIGLIVSMALFFLGEMNSLGGWMLALFISAYISYGNFAPFFEIGAAITVDGVRKNVHLMPLMSIVFYFYMWNMGLGLMDAIFDLMTQRKVFWDKTLRFNNSEEKR